MKAPFRLSYVVIVLPFALCSCNRHEAGHESSHPGESLREAQVSFKTPPRDYSTWMKDYGGNEPDLASDEGRKRLEDEKHRLSAASVKFTEVLKDLSAVFVFFARMSSQMQNEYLATRTLRFYYDPIMDASTGNVSRTECLECQDLVVDAVFHMRSAVNFINRASSRKALVGRFMAAHPEWNDGDSVEDAFRGLKVELKNGLPPTALIFVRSGSSELSQTVVGFYAAEVMTYFRNENDGLCKKMSAWFESQKAGKGKDEIDKIECQKRMAFRNAKRKSMRVVEDAERAIKDTRCDPFTPLGVSLTNTYGALHFTNSTSSVRQVDLDVDTFLRKR